MALRANLLYPLMCSYDHIDVEAMKKAGVKVGLAMGVLQVGAAEHTIGLTLMTLMRVKEHIRYNLCVGETTAILYNPPVFSGWSNETAGKVASRARCSTRKWATDWLARSWDWWDWAALGCKWPKDLYPLTSRIFCTHPGVQLLRFS